MISNHKNTTNKVMLLGIMLCMFYIYATPLINAPAVRQVLGLKRASFEILFLSRMLHWLLLLLAWGYAVRIEKQDFTLWKNRNYKLPKLLLHIVLLYFAVIIIATPLNLLVNWCGLHQESRQLKTIISILAHHHSMIPFICMTAGVVEEYIFRGYIQPRLEVVFKSPLAAILISSVLFAAVHYGYGTVINVMVPFVIGLVFSIYYWKYRNIYALIVCHFLIDFISLYATVKS